MACPVTASERSAISTDMMVLGCFRISWQMLMNCYWKICMPVAGEEVFADSAAILTMRDWNFALKL